MRRILGLARDIASANLGRDVPYRVSLILNYRCNCRCSMCRIWRKGEDGSITASELRRFFTRNPRISWLNLSGGEIFLRHDLVEMLEAIYETADRLFLLDFPTTGIQTKAIVAAVRRVLALGAAKLIVTVSLDGPPEVHERVRGVPGGFDRTLRTFRELRALRSSRFGVYLGMTLGADGEAGVDEMLAAVTERIPGFEADELHVNLLHTSAHYYRNLDVARPSADWVLDQIRELLARKRPPLHPVALLEHRYQSLLESYLTTGRTPLPCVALRDNCFIDPDWNVYPCSIWDAPIGNLRDFDFDLERIVHSDEGRARRDAVERESCPHCWTPCEAYATLFGNLKRPFPRGRLALRQEPPMVVEQVGGVSDR